MHQPVLGALLPLLSELLRLCDGGGAKAWGLEGRLVGFEEACQVPPVAWGWGGSCSLIFLVGEFELFAEAELSSICPWV